MKTLFSKTIIISLLILPSGCKVTCDNRAAKGIVKKIFPYVEREYNIESLFGNDIRGEFVIGSSSDGKYKFYEISSMYNGILYRIKLPKSIAKLYMDSNKPYIKVTIRTEVEGAKDNCFFDTLIDTIGALKSVNCWACLAGPPDVVFEIHVPKDAFVIKLDLKREFMDGIL